MFVSAIDTAACFTRPIHTIMRLSGETTVIPGAATLFFVNADGWALTCKHVASELVAAEQLATKRAAFNAERAELATGTASRQPLRALERKHGFTRGVTVEMHHRFINCVDGSFQLEIRLHPTLDVALLHFKHCKALRPTAFAVFAARGDELKQGKSLCRLGFPFPEFTNFAYDADADQIGWTTTGRAETPQFPIDGMVTRHLNGPDGIVGVELSTPGLRGQSGGPAFDSAGVVWGMQSATNHLDLNFDVDMPVRRNGQVRHVRDSAFLHVGHCVHVDVLTQFMRDNGVSFEQAS
ncbi:MAG: trypsin-like peptidase domain-containing protein [Acidobacteria bacterium]|nr:trypsin-like peptidase domain-containing protein [Acidobacteriota bacterium]